MQHSLSLDFVLSFCRDKIPGRGEDSYCYSFCDSAGMLGVFDGCGGIGGKTHDFYSGYTEAYIASRLCAGSFYDDFCALFPCAYPSDRLASEIFAPNAIHRLKTFDPPKDESGFQIKGSSVRTLPSTAAVSLVRLCNDGSTQVSAMWAGDSRVYLLDANGLAQLTVDDTGVTDPMENLYRDGALRNVFCSDKPVTLHCSSFQIQSPFVVFSATDGCFGYVSTPMEFEGILLKTLLRATCVAQWEAELAAAISSVAGDDHALCLAAYGYGSFPALQQNLAGRYAYLERNYLAPVANLPVADVASRIALWNTYRGQYMRFMERGQA